MKNQQELSGRQRFRLNQNMCVEPYCKNDENSDVIILSIIIVNYNGRAFLKSCLEAVLRHVACPHEIIIVDNNSHDDSREYLCSNWPDVRLVNSSENLGFARGNNRGAEFARGKYLLLLNNDTEIQEPVHPLLDYLERNPETAIVGGRLRNQDGSIQASVGYDHTPFRLVFSWMVPRTYSGFSQWQIYEKKPDYYMLHHNHVDWVSGAYLFIRKNIWQELSGFDQDIFMYVEDVDICRRARQLGKKVAYVAAGDTCHFEGSGQKGMSKHALLATVDSYRLLLKKQYGTVIRNITCAALSLVFLGRAALYLLSSVAGNNPANSAKAGFYREASGRLLWGSVVSTRPHQHGESN